MRTWLIACLLLQVVQFWGPSINKKNKEGAKLYEEGKLDDALVAFTQAQEESPDASEIQYNIANISYRKEEMDKALDGYRAAQNGSDEVQRRAHFNTGNVFHKGGKFPDAVAAYKEALKIDDQDSEARQNLELSLKKQEEQEQQDGGGDSGESDENQQDQPQPQGQQDQEQPQNQPQPEDQAMDSSDQGGEAMPQGMSKEEAERILAALAEMEKAQQRKQQQQKKIKASASGKDW